MSFQLCRSDEVMVNGQTMSSLYTIEDSIHMFYGTNGDFYFKFIIKIVNENAVPISDASEIIIDSRRKFYQIAIVIF